jgi:hypothetical protein
VTKYKSTAEDYDLWLKLSLENKIYYIVKPLIKYRLHANLTFREDNLPIIYLNSIDILYKYGNVVPRPFRKFAIWGANKFRRELISLNLSKSEFFSAIKEILKMVFDFRYLDYLMLVFYKIFHPNRSILHYLEENYESRNIHVEI